MSKTPDYDAKVKTILDATQPGERICELTGEKWNMTEEEISWYRKFNTPPSKFHPLTRWWIETGFFISYQWWWQKHPETGKPLLGFVHPATGLKIIPDTEWFEKDYEKVGQEVNLSKPFFEQLRMIQEQVPLLADRNAQEPQNSIAKFSLGDVNSYFTMFCRSKNTIFSIWVFDIEESSEVSAGEKIQYSYNILDSHRIFRCQFIRNSFDCMNSAFLFDCRNCEYCFGATNKRNRKYLWWNEQLTKEEWEKRRAEVNFSCRSVVESFFEKFQKFIQEEAVWPENFNERAQGSTGERLTNVTNLSQCYNCIDGVKNSYSISYSTGQTEDSAFSSGLFSSSKNYYCTNSVRSSQLLFCYSCSDSQNLEYCMQCYNCEYCLGCVGLNRKKFCIFNKSYTEQDYWQKVDELKCVMLEKGEYGEFFPLSMSPSYFPDSGAPLFMGAPFEIGKEKLGARDFDAESLGAMGEALSDDSKLRYVKDVPDCLSEVKDEEWVNIPVFDPIKKRRFAYIKPEINFYREQKIGVPKKHFIRRLQELFLESNSGKFEQAICAHCQKKLLVSFNPTYKERKIYCKSCYLKYLEEHG